MYEGLSIEAIMKESANHPVVARYLPDAKDIPRLPRQWLVNLM